MSEVDNCFEKGLLVKIPKNKTFALNDLDQADFFLNEAYDLIKLEKEEMASIALYNSVFHAARALLYLDGVKEKSHHCLQKYLEEKYSKELSSDQLSLFDVLKGIRQEVQYNVMRIKIDENLDELYNKAEDFIERIKIIVKNSGM